ncbi:MAG: methyltransferase domain-containing protein [Planctomycetes bacterium]|nr:methyltransferase domain-containing protein [Planctomycetota bacterium]
MLSTAALLLATLLSARQAPQDPEQTPAGRTHFLGREIAQTMHWTGAPWLLRQTREQEENGELLRRWLDVRPGQGGCDLGCGNGYHTLPLAEAVGEGGVVYAVDLQPQMLALLRQRGAARELTNLRFVEATVSDPRLPPASCDLVLMVDVYHELSHPVSVMTAVRRALRPGGRVVLVEFRAEDEEVPIKPEHKMTKAQVVLEMATHGFDLADEFDGLPWQNAMAFTAAAETGARHVPRQVLRGFLRACAGGDERVLQPFLAAGVKAEELPLLAPDLRAELRAGPSGGLLAALRGADGGPVAHGRDEVELTADAAGRWRVAAVRAASAWRPFVAMQTALGGGAVAARVALAHELGFAGVAWHLEGLDEARRACEELGGDLASAYVVLDVADADAARLEPVRAAMRSLSGGPGMVWLALQNGRAAPRASAGDEAAVAALRTLLAFADAAGVEVALYPHHGFWLETTEDALRLVERIDHARLGVCFNLCHFLRAGVATDPAPLLARCGARLFAVTVNGADLAGEDWATLIRPLGEGDFDLRGFRTTLDRLGFAGPIGLQGYGITAPPREHLTASMAAWRAAAPQRR